MKITAYLFVLVLGVSIERSVGDDLEAMLSNATAGSMLEDEQLYSSAHAERRLAVNGVGITWYNRHTNPATAATWQTWQSEKAFCERQGKRLCSYTELCPNGVGNHANGFSGSNDRWVAVSISFTCPNNGWIQVGLNGGEGNRCKRHEDWGFCPSWGLNHQGGAAYYFENIPCCNIASKNSGSCFRSGGWCTHPGSVYLAADCNGDGIADHTCIDRNGNRGTLMSGLDCGGTWPNAPQEECPRAFGTCARPPHWCTHPGSKYNYVDCDGDGMPDHNCYDVNGNRGTIGTASNCASTWPNAPQSSCPAVFGSCARGHWCTHGGATYKYWDCSGNGQAQHICYDTAGSKGFMLDNCGHNWPHGGSCPGIF